MRCPACDHDPTRTEKVLEHQIKLLNDQLQKANTCATLRDQFAMAAMQGWLATYGDHEHPAITENIDQVASMSYDMADAMLKAREPKP